MDKSRSKVLHILGTIHTFFCKLQLNYHVFANRNFMIIIFNHILAMCILIVELESEKVYSPRLIVVFDVCG